ncbi:MarR family transcriptional regulator [Alicyclobacillus dauci]|uniref:MarR family transcriptional regulator n=1 Tax=Alicyclobacillus dauci TaxID=1475485 RepID=A0ABY6Z5U3_9BACL|nr:MarR family transcriptional regulator [Alicyclobacillus dauci]WAH38273.1 MarR family transcriptional regulator [Alicyclobacillus dauci]
MANLMRIQADKLDLTPVQIMILRILEEKPNLSLSELSERVQLGCSTVSVVVKRLVEDGVLERERLEQDQRTVAIRLTDKGRELNKQAFGEDSLLTLALQRFVRLPEKHIDTLLALHRELNAILSTEGELPE